MENLRAERQRNASEQKPCVARHGRADGRRQTRLSQGVFWSLPPSVPSCYEPNSQLDLILHIAPAAVLVVK
jgi:hypothetical protein